jgi:peptide-methionine (S)-S-oxide reductase
MTRLKPNVLRILITLSLLFAFTPAVGAAPAVRGATHMDKTTTVEKATFAAGCFWGVEAAFRQIKGVVSTQVGYTGGHTAKPTYEDVCTDQTGHAEAVEVTYDPSRVRYEDLLTVFWTNHDPTTTNRQGPDVGTQYRSAIFFHSPAQEATARASKAHLESEHRFKRPIVTQIVAAGPFYRAEDYHQQYLEKRGLSVCHIK